jgi:FkbM family methyltransferase
MITTTFLNEAAERNADRLRQVLRHYGWLYRLRPQSVVTPFYRLVGPRGGRAIIEVDGTRLFVDPFTHLGRQLISNGCFEPDMCSLVREMVPEGGTFLDIGANEGAISAFAARCAGPRGLVVAVEPQARLRDILEINLALNSHADFRIIEAAIAATEGEQVTLQLGPASHSGGSSIVRPRRWMALKEQVATRTIDSIVSDLEPRGVDLMKVDVEGYELEVIQSARSALAGKKIGCLAVDFHDAILKSRGVNTYDLDAEIQSHGYTRRSGTPDGGYAIYGA